MLTGLSVCGDKRFHGLRDRDQVSRNFCLLEGRDQGALQKPTHITNSCHLLTSVRDVSGVWGTIPRQEVLGQEMVRINSVPISRGAVAVNTESNR